MFNNRLFDDVDHDKSIHSRLILKSFRKYLCKEQLKCVLIHIETSCSCDHVYSNTLELHTWHTQNQERFFLVNNIEDTYIFFLYASAVSQSITHFIYVITINILIVHSDRSWEINVQQWYILLDDEMLTNHVHLDINLHVNLRFCLLIFLNYMLFIYKNLYEEKFLFFPWWFEAFIKNLSFFKILKRLICDIESMNTRFASDSFDLFLIFSSLQSVK